jgi:hypothetical protein
MNCGVFAFYPASGKPSRYYSMAYARILKSNKEGIKPE